MFQNAFLGMASVLAALVGHVMAGFLPPGLAGALAPVVGMVLAQKLDQRATGGLQTEIDKAVTGYLMQRKQQVLTCMAFAMVVGSLTALAWPIEFAAALGVAAFAVFAIKLLRP